MNCFVVDVNNNLIVNVCIIIYSLSLPKSITSLYQYLIYQCRGNTTTLEMVVAAINNMVYQHPNKDSFNIELIILKEIFKGTKFMEVLEDPRIQTHEYLERVMFIQGYSDIIVHF